jgi:Tfp pilus assembly protein PilO
MMRRFQNLWPLAREYPFCGICAAMSVAFAIGSLVLWVRMNALSKLQHARQVEGEAVQATLISAPQLRQELALVQHTLKRITDNLASEENLADNINYFYNMEETSKAHLEDLRPFNIPVPDTGTPYRRIPFGIRVSGSYAQVAAYIHAVETGPRLSTITYFSLRKRPGTSFVVADFNVDLLGKR